MMHAVKSFEVVIEGPNWQDVQKIELPRPPQEGDTLETRYGTCVVTGVELSGGGESAGRIVCRLP
jgi:hypothetical protein